MKTCPRRHPLEMCPPSHVGGVARGNHGWVTDYLRCHKFQSDTPSSPEVMPAHGTSRITPVDQRRRSCCINKRLSDVLSLTHTPALYLHTHFTSCFSPQYHTVTLSPSHFAFLSSLSLSVSLLSEPWKLPIRQIHIF